MVDPPA
jgi:hypothetical protein